MGLETTIYYGLWTAIIIAIVVSVVKSSKRRAGEQQSAAPGWYPDPTRRHSHRYWDGTAWTSAIADAGVQGEDPV